MNAKHHVPTRAIQDAVKGREIEIIDALTIDWQAGHPHITCPYPSHDDSKASWRWDDAKTRAFCTRIQGSHSILDVMMVMEDGGDFDVAKMRAIRQSERPQPLRQSDSYASPPCVMTMTREGAQPPPAQSRLRRACSVTGVDQTV